MPARTPAEAIELFADALNHGDLEAAMQLYEPQAVFAPQPGQVVTGHAGIREALAGFLSLKPTITGQLQKVLQAADTALVVNQWTLKGTQPDGSPVQLAGTSADVVRRQPDGTWLVAVDDPWGCGPQADKHAGTPMRWNRRREEAKILRWPPRATPRWPSGSAARARR